MAGASNYLELELLDHVFGGNTAGNVFTPNATLYMSLHTADPAETGASEVTNANAYARVSIANTTTNWSAASAGAKTNATAINFPTASGAWGTVTHFGFWDSGTHGAGNFLVGGSLSVSKAPISGDQPQFAASSLSITLD